MRLKNAMHLIINRYNLFDRPCHPTGQDPSRDQARLPLRLRHNAEALPYTWTDP
jgi:hypothetical protein